MLLLLFKIGQHRYGVDADSIIEIVPAVQLREFPSAPNFIPGFLDYRGSITPVIDASLLTISKPSAIRLSTRIAVFKYPSNQENFRPLALLAENMTDIIDIDSSLLKDPGIQSKKKPFLGPIYKTDSEFIQTLDLSNILSENLKTSLFKNIEASQ